jgi:DNA-binding MarR family transcriptional regulator
LMPSQSKPSVNDIEQIRQEILTMQLSRLIAFSDVINRFLHLRLKEYKNWLKVNTVLFLITRGGETTPSQLGKLMLRSKNSMTKIIDNLEKEQLVRRVRSQKDRRTIYLEVTADGLEFTMSHLKELDALEKEIKACLEPDELPLLVGLSRKLRLKLIENITGLKSQQ